MSAILMLLCAFIATSERGVNCNKTCMYIKDIQKTSQNLITNMAALKGDVNLWFHAGSKIDILVVQLRIQSLA